MNDYEKYEKARKETQASNAVLLNEFEEWLDRIGLSKKTINKHVGNIDFYINEFLLYSDVIEPADGITEVDMFLHDWFIRKALWASESSIRGYATSLKKFYLFMNEKGHTSKESLDHLRNTIREGMPEWVATVKRYDDPDIEDPYEIWGL